MTNLCILLTQEIRPIDKMLISPDLISPSLCLMILGGVHLLEVLFSMQMSINIITGQRVESR